MTNVNLFLKLTRYIGSLTFVSIVYSSALAQDQDQIRKKAIKCNSEMNYTCAEENYRKFLKKKPDDVSALANLAFSLTKQDKDPEAIQLYERLLDEGEGTWDIFANYAKSLKSTGRDEDAITWNYRTLQTLPSLVDVRSDLAKLLLKKNRGYEGLALLAAFDEDLQAKGQRPYFTGQKLALVNAIKRKEQQNTHANVKNLRLARIEQHFYGTLSSGESDSVPVMIDTGASSISLSYETLHKLDLKVPSNAKTIKLRLADNSIVTGKSFFIKGLKLGPIDLQQVNIIVCDNCASLFGQSGLSQFDTTTQKVSGVEFMDLKPRSL